MERILRELGGSGEDSAGTFLSQALDNDLHRTAKNFLADAHRTFVVVQYLPYKIAIGALFLSLVFRAQREKPLGERLTQWAPSPEALAETEAYDNARFPPYPERHPNFAHNPPSPRRERSPTPSRSAVAKASGSGGDPIPFARPTPATTCPTVGSSSTPMSPDAAGVQVPVASI